MNTEHNQSKEQQIGDRRPLASRNTGWAHKATEKLAQTAITPNQISIGSMVFAAIAGLLFYMSGAGGALADPISGGVRATLLLLAAFACQCRLLCNLFDGMLAVEAGRRTADGLAWNEFPDRYADILIFIGIGYGIGWPSLGWAAACFSVLTAYTRELGNAVDAGADFSGPMAKQHRMATVTVASIIAAIVSVVTPISQYAGAVMTIALVVVAIGALITSVRRSYRMIDHLNR